MQHKIIIIFIYTLLQVGMSQFIKGDVLSSSKKEWTAEDIKRVRERFINSINELNKPDYFLEQLQQIQESAPVQQQKDAYNILSKQITYILELQTELEWIRLEALRESINTQLKSPSFDTTRANSLFKQIEGLIQDTWEGLYTYNPETIQKAEQLLALKRELVLLNPQIDFDKILTVKYTYPEVAPFIMAQQLGVQPNNWANQTSTRRHGFQAELVELSGIQNGSLQEKTIFTPPVNGSALTDLQLHWDADRVMFTTLDTDRKWQVFEIDTEGNNLRKVINSIEPDLEFFDATYLPDGRIMAVSNLGYHGVPCVNGSDEVGNMILYNPENETMRRITFDQDANWNPTILANGKVMYTRWEYTDLTHYFSRMVMHMNPDGTEQKSLYGSGSMFPNSIFDMKPLPEQTNRFVGIISGHHGVARSGRLMIFDPAKSRKEEKGMIQELPFRGREIIPEVKDELVDGVWPQFIKPYPISDDYFLVTAKLSPYSRWGIYLVDVYDNLTLITNADNSGFIYSIPVKKQKTPPAIPDKIKPEEKEATVFIQDIYEGEGLPGVPRGEVKSIRVFAYEYAYQKTLSDHYNHGIQAGWDIKRLLGIVPVEEDGSAIFKIPANTPVSLQPLDSEGRAIQWMRSWLTGMPGEIVSCVGCHEDQNQIPIPKRVQASVRPPHPLHIADGGIRSYTFKYEIEPILDRACVSCHNADYNPSIPDFKDKSEADITDWSGTRYFAKNYLAFHPYVNRQGPEADMVVMTPYEYHASTSEVVRILKRGHYGVELTEQEWNKLYTWIDLNAPGRGWFDADSIKGYDQYKRRIELADKYSGGGVDWRKELEEYAARLEKVEPVTYTQTRTVKKEYKAPKLKGWPLSDEQIQQLLAKEGTLRKEVEIADGINITFVRIPAGKFIMGNNEGYPNEAPASIVEIKKPFWMAEKELTNQQYNALVPEHDSRIYAQFWKDHTTPGYPANEPGQPVIRVSYQEALHYCEQLSALTGLKVNLPTEAQWEWACRAGKDTPFWYGNINTDFGKYENLADVQLEKMAVTGIDPQPMPKDDPWFPYYNYLPKMDTVDDGLMLPAEEYPYEKNPFGLLNIHGNLSEWTRSAYLPYPYKEQDNRHVTAESVVARGGSWIDRPKDATATVRKDYLPWQKVNNVGIRLILED